MTKPNENPFTDQFETWMKAATRFFVLANAGGAVATLGFLGTSMAGGASSKFAILPLVFFVLGVAVAGTAIFGQLVSAWVAWSGHGLVTGDEGPKRSLAVRLGMRVEPHTGAVLLTAFGFFLAGAVLGIAALLLVSPNELSAVRPC